MVDSHHREYKAVPGKMYKQIIKVDQLHQDRKCWAI